MSAPSSIQDALTTHGGDWSLMIGRWYVHCARTDSPTAPFYLTATCGGVALVFGSGDDAYVGRVVAACAMLDDVRVTAAYGRSGTL